MTDAYHRIGKWLSYVLRHKPESAGLTMDRHGWVKMTDLVYALFSRDSAINRALIEEVVKRDDKQRFTINSDGTCIRANYGHSVPVDLGLKPQKPPDSLFHGTAQTSVHAIKKAGILSKDRQYVHLSTTISAAAHIGKRHGRPAVLQIASRTMYDEGHIFYTTDNTLWLTDHVPPVFITEIYESPAVYTLEPLPSGDSH